MTLIKLTRGEFEYDQTAPLGKAGGFGQVFAGRSAKNPRLAVKKLHLSAEDAAHRELKIADELAARNLKHVVPIIDSGEDALSGNYFIVMARADESLDDFLRKNGKLSASVTAEILLQIVNGLIEVGDLVHRDLKPQNILLHEGSWKIADFGIARFVEASTSTKTLKGFLSPFYAAPEQWKQEHATKATDVYALGCIAFCLVTGHPPFTTNPNDEHQHSPVPPYDCDENRLRSVIQMALRKLPESRPSVERVRQILQQVTTTPMVDAGTAAAKLAEIGAKIAEAQTREQAEREALRKAKLTRDAQAQDAFQRLSGIRKNLWKSISEAAPAARVNSQDSTSVEYQLGSATLWLQVAGPAHAIHSGAFAESKWDVITFSQIVVEQQQPNLIWSATLWFARLPKTNDYRWYEVSYVEPFGPGLLIPSAEINVREADLAASTVTHSKVVAFGPEAIDDEDESSFQDRWIWLFAEAAAGQLRSLSTAPIRGWPPAFA